MKSGWMRLVRMAAAGTLAVGLWAHGAGAAEVKNVEAEYAWPWGAEIRYRVIGLVVTNDPLVMTATDRANNISYMSQGSALSGDTGSNDGDHHVVWHLDKQGMRIQSTNVVFTVEYLPMYCVVDLSGGTNAASYPITYLDVPPSGGFTTDTYKTTKLVLRGIGSGTFTMGGDYPVTLTKPYYMGLFEVTQKQWELVMGRNPARWRGDGQAVDSVSYTDIRGNSLGRKWPTSNAVDADSFLGKLRMKTGLEFDLPTEAQWEYACRAGTTTIYSYGNTPSEDYMWYNHDNSAQSSHDVGTKLPNAWELYDMHGNVLELCLDWFGNLASEATDPKGPTSGTERVVRGGSWLHSADACTSSSRGGRAPENGHDRIGFRLACPMAN